MQADLDVLLEIASRLRLSLDTLDALPLHLHSRLHSVAHLILDDGEEGARADRGVRARGHKPVREAVEGDREVRLGERVPPVSEVDAVAPDDGEREVEGRVEACGRMSKGQ